jgi:hypothetical protein
MVCYVPTQQSQPSFLINRTTLRNEASSDLLGAEGVRLRDRIQTLKQDSEPILRLLEQRRKRLQRLENLNRLEGLNAYLTRLKDEATSTDCDANFTVKVLCNAQKVWNDLNNHFQAGYQELIVPDACIGNTDNFMYTWIKDEHYLECEIFGNGEIEFFYRQEITGQVWGEDTTLDNLLLATILEKVAIFVRA